MEGKWKDWYSWSRAKESIFDKCPRAFYYRYIEFYDSDLNSIFSVTKRMLDNVHNINFLLGDLVHKAIERQFDQLSRRRNVPNHEPALQFISRQIDDIIRNPRKYIIEALNGKQILQEEYIKISEEAKRQVKIFFTEFFEFYKDLEIITHEKFCDITINGYKFYFVPDLVTRSKDGKIYITDWKTDSSYSDAIDDHQMKLYILWALKKGLANLDNLRAEVIYLDEGKSHDFQATQEDINQFEKDIIKKSTDFFQKIESKSGKEDFQKQLNEENCISCGFKQYCDKDN